jgi:hypothetical protein
MHLNTKKMKITVTKIKRLLVKEYGWSEIALRDTPIATLIIQDTLQIIENELRTLKGISIKGK